MDCKKLFRIFLSLINLLFRAFFTALFLLFRDFATILIAKLIKKIPDNQMLYIGFVSKNKSNKFLLTYASWKYFVVICKHIYT